MDPLIERKRGKLETVTVTKSSNEEGEALKYFNDLLITNEGNFYRVGV